MASEGKSSVVASDFEIFVGRCEIELMTELRDLV